MCVCVGVCVNFWHVFTGWNFFHTHTHFCQDKFMARLEVVVTKKASNKVTIDGGWYSEKEMREDLKWTANFDCI